MSISISQNTSRYFKVSTPRMGFDRLYQFYRLKDYRKFLDGKVTNYDIITDSHALFLQEAIKYSPFSIEAHLSVRH